MDQLALGRSAFVHCQPFAFAAAFNYRSQMSQLTVTHPSRASKRY